VPLRTPGSRNVRARSGGEPVVGDVTVTVVGFVLTTTLVIVMARRSTAAWEREKRAAAVPRRPRPTSPPSSGGAADRARAVLVRGAATGLRLTRSVRTRLGAAGRLAAGPAERLRPPARALRKAAGRLTSARSGADAQPSPAIGVAHPWAVSDGEEAPPSAPPEDEAAAQAPQEADGGEPESRPRRRRPLRLPHRHGPRSRVSR
jgi:hypothetical protein